MDLRSPGCHYALAMTPSNIYVMLQKYISKHADIHRKTYSAQTSLIGLKKQNIKAMAFSATARADRLNKKKEAAYAKQAAAAAAGASVLSLPRSDIDSVASHRFSLSFDTITNTRNAILYLDSIGLTPMISGTKIIKGKVIGFSYLTPTHAIQTHLKEHAYYVGGCPSLKLSRVIHTGMRGIDDEMYRDECLFECLESEFAHALQISRINSPHPLRWYTYQAPTITVCTHCYKTGHTRKSCPQANTTNTQGLRDACCACGSFAHGVNTCDEMNKPTYACLLCNAAKHTMYGCPALAIN